MAAYWIRYTAAGYTRAAIRTLYTYEGFLALLDDLRADSGITVLGFGYSALRRSHMPPLRPMPPDKVNGALLLWKLGIDMKGKESDSSSE